MKKLVLLLLVISFSFSGCEKDDICDEDTSTTPSVIIEFYDVLNPTVLKEVTNLKVIGIINNVELPNPLGTFDAETKIALTLSTDLDTVKYKLILNSTNTAVANTDYIEFNYTRKNVYVSRACGYKTVFTLNANPVITDTTPTDGLWIQNSTTTTLNIETENETHIKIYL